MEMRSTILLLVIAAFATGFAEETADRGRWSFSAGPAWRSAVKMEMRGVGRVQQLTPSSSEGYGDFTPGDQSTWVGHSIHGPVDVPERYSPYPGQQTWAIDATRTVVDVASGSEGRVGSSNDEGAMGLDLSAGYDFLQGEMFSLGVGLRFAGYWNLKSTTTGGSSGGTIRTRKYTDSFLFITGIDSSDPAPTAGGVYYPESTADYRGTTPDSDVTEVVGGRSFRSRLRTDLYQIGLGPKATWHAFSWLDAYAGADVLLNLANVDFDSDGTSSSHTDCLIGCGGKVGLVGRVTDNLGVFAQVGYEWIDESDAFAGGFRSKVDYSSLVLSAGVQLRF